ncbi:MAG: uracil-DNA glycosylase family protein [Pseudomonadota bacterium]
MTSLETLTAEVHACRLCADRFSGTATAHVPRPVPWLSDVAPILVAGQAPGMRVHKSGRPFDDASGDRLRAWMGIDRETFYDRRQIAVLPMAFCFPGYDARGSDLPPPKICAATWHERAMAEMPQVRLKLLIGGASQQWHLGRMAVTERVQRWRETVPDALPLPHPSWRNTGWLKKNPWFEEEVVPWLRTRIAAVLGR